MALLSRVSADLVTVAAINRAADFTVIIRGREASETTSMKIICSITTLRRQRQEANLKGYHSCCSCIPTGKIMDC